MATQIQIRRDSTTNWDLINPILAQGEIGYDITTNTIKIGDGVTHWTGLTFGGGGGGTNGTSGTNGAAGASGTNGTSGTNGADGSGTNGTSGTDGIGISGTNGTSGTNGADGAGVTGIINKAILYNNAGSVSGGTNFRLTGGTFIWNPHFQTGETADTFWRPTTTGFRLNVPLSEVISNWQYDDSWGITIGNRTGDCGMGSLANSPLASNPATARGASSIAWGYNVTITAPFSVGFFGNVSAPFGFVGGGQYCVVSGQQAFSTGYQCQTTADNGFSNGDNSIASAYASTASGYYVTANSHSQSVVGSYNITTGSTTFSDLNSPRFIVGVGTGSTYKFNALTVSHNDTKIFNNLTVLGTITQKYKITNISTEYTGTTSDQYIRCSGASYTLALPVATGSGNLITVKNLGSGTITIVSLSSGLIDGVSSKTLTTGNTYYKLIDAASGFWEII